MNSMHTICNTRVRLAACTCPCPGVQRREASCPADRVYNPRAFHCGYTTIRKHCVCWVCARGRAAPSRNTQTCTMHTCALARNACSILATVAAMYTHVWIFIFPYFITGIRTSVFITDFRMKYGKSVLLGSSAKPLISLNSENKSTLELPEEV